MKKLGFLAVFALMFGVCGAAFAQEAVQEETQKVAVQETVEQKSALTVSDSAICTASSEKMPEGKSAEFTKDVPKLYYWTKIEGAEEATEIKHIWYLGETVIGEVPLTITTPSFRTWSSKTIYPGLEGELSVAVVDADGNVLKKDAFTIK